MKVRISDFSKPVPAAISSAHKVSPQGSCMQQDLSSQREPLACCPVAPSPAPHDEKLPEPRDRVHLETVTPRRVEEQVSRPGLLTWTPAPADVEVHQNCVIEGNRAASPRTPRPRESWAVRSRGGNSSRTYSPSRSTSPTKSPRTPCSREAKCSASLDRSTRSMRKDASAPASKPGTPSRRPRRLVTASSIQSVGEVEHFDSDEDASCKTPRFAIRWTPVTTPDSSPRKWSPSRFRRGSLYIPKFLSSVADDPEGVCALASHLMFKGLPSENVEDFTPTALVKTSTHTAFLATLQADGGDISRIRIAWHLAGSAAAAASIESTGIRCDDGHCACGRYGRGGYVATCASKANAYAESSSGLRHLFLVLINPEDELIKGERGSRPKRTAADLPSHPTEYCFVDPSRLHCVCRMDYTWVPTGRRAKVASAGNHVRAWRLQSGKL